MQKIQAGSALFLGATVNDDVTASAGRGQRFMRQEHGGHDRRRQKKHGMSDNRESKTRFSRDPEYLQDLHHCELECADCRWRRRHRYGKEYSSHDHQRRRHRRNVETDGESDNPGRDAHQEPVDRAESQ